MAARPIIKLEWTAWDKILEGLGFLALVLLLVIPIYYYPELPDRIPKHYDATGQVTAYGGKGILWVMPIIGLITYAGLFFINKVPHIFNYPTEITTENAERQYRIATRMIRTLNVIIVYTFLYTSYGTIQNAMGIQVGLGKAFIPIFLIALFGTIVVYLVKAFRK
ncbi:DUF1648 domain-containing protein [Cecembia rubra]|uniref:Uncharacterized protein DUF1648 n=1 Tax=Cecembia rubra TaxID=1485585 RepID=A0A2P8E8F6_9BACT|nr:DUF1648 domain-containing protein [Cecembia rubra]PSL05762.1 uncharacterized protein DUF1648 [Cecembia rubra]